MGPHFIPGGQFLREHCERCRHGGPGGGKCEVLREVGYTWPPVPELRYRYWFQTCSREQPAIRDASAQLEMIL